MKVKFKKENKDRNRAQQILKSCLSEFSLTEQGQFSYTSNSEILMSFLYDQLNFKSHIEKNSFYQDFKESISESYRTHTKETQLEDIETTFNHKINRRKDKKFSLVSSLNINYYKIFSELNISDCKIRFYRKIPSKYLKHRDPFINQYDPNYQNEGELTWVVVTTYDFSPRQAAERCIDCLDIVRAVIELDIRQQRNMMGPTSEQYWPSKMQLVLNQYHTIHNLSDGKLALNLVFFEHGYTKNSVLPVKDPKLTFGNLKKRLSLLEKKPYKDHLKISLSLFSKATGNIDAEGRLVLMWSVFEQLLNDDNTTSLIKKISSIYSNPNEVKPILLTMRESRNRYLHKGIPPSNIEMKSHILKNILIDTLKYFIANNLKVVNLQEMLDIMNLPMDKKTLENSIRLIKMKRSFIVNQ